MPNNLLAVQHLTKHYSLDSGPLRRLLPGRQRRVLRAVDGVSFTMAPTETLGLVGESGCGKTTTGRLILRAIEPTSGCILFNGQAITALHGKALQPFRRQAQIVFQDPYASLNPRLTVSQIIGEPMCVHRLASKETVHDAAVKVLMAEAPSAIILHENEQKIFAKYVKGFQPIPVNAIDMHRVWLDKA